MKPSGAVSGRFWRVIFAAILLFFSYALSSCTSGAKAAPSPTPTSIPPDQGEVQVFVLDSQTKQSINGVVVRVTNTPLVDGVDHRELRLLSCEAGQFLVVSAPGYETGYTPCNGSNTYYFFLNLLSKSDNVNYAWSSASDCGTCHTGQLNDGYKEVNEWSKSGHARVFLDTYFETVYRGINVNGQSNAPGFKLDQPDKAGNCAYCHAPTAIPSSLASADLSSYYPRPGGVNGEGITCDICHKVYGVTLNENNYPKDDKPGVLSLKFLKLSNAFVLGPFSNIRLPLNDDSRRHASSSCAPIMSSGEFCATCHYGKFNDMVIYNSYGEWRDSLYGKNPRDPTYKTCQDCHMSHMDVGNVETPLSARGACSETTEQYQDFDHNMMDVGSVKLSDGSEIIIPRMIQDAASLKVKLKYEPDQNNSLRVRVEVENKTAGHKFPTDSPLRHLILVISATDQFGSFLTQVRGDQLPDWAGDPAKSLYGVQGYAGLPGTIYANLLAEEATNVSPTAAYWNKTKYASVTKDGKTSDTRLLPGDPQVSNYSFAIPDLGNVHVTVKLIYRYAFFDIMQQKDWSRPDIVVAMTDCQLSLDQADNFECSKVQP